MSVEEKIARMVASGSITPQQAEEMRASILTMGKPTFERVRRKLPLGLIVSSICVVLLAILLMTGGGNAEPETIQNVSEIMNEPGKVGAMSKEITKGVSLFIILLPIVLSVIGFVWIYNELVNKEEEVLASWAQVETNYQRRTDLVPNLVESVKSFVDHEEKVLTAVTQSRQKVLNVMKGVVDKLEDEAALSAVARAQKELGDDVTRLFGLVENYPNLRSSDNFLALQDQLEGTENRINVARMVFNESVRDYNGAIRKMPGALIAGMGDFKRKAYFKADEGANKAVKVDF